MDVLDGPYYHRCKTYLGVFGVWSLQSARSKLFLRVTSYVVWTTIFVPTLCKAYELRHHFYYFLLCVPNLIFYTRYFAKLTHLILKDSQSRHLLQLVGRDFRSFAGENFVILHRYARQATRLNKIYAYFLLSITCAFGITSIAPNHSDLPSSSNTTRIRNSPCTIMHGFVLDVFATVLNLGFDALMLNHAQHGCALFQIVARELKYVLRNNNDNSTNVLYERVTRVVKLHNHAINFVDLAESAYSMQHLLVTGLTLAAITISEFEIATNKPHRNVRFRFVIYGAGELLRVLFLNYPGQRIRDHSVMIYQSCYNTQWYREDVPKECRKLLSLMMLRSQKSCCLTGGGLYILGLENYVTILKASLTYFTFLSSML